jgi:hypothetical protein
VTEGSLNVLPSLPHPLPFLQSLHCQFSGPFLLPSLYSPLRFQAHPRGLPGGNQVHPILLYSLTHFVHCPSPPLESMPGFLVNLEYLVKFLDKLFDII